MGRAVKHLHEPTPTIKRYAHKGKQDDSETKGHHVIIRDKTQDGSGQSNIHQQHENKSESDSKSTSREHTYEV